MLSGNGGTNLKQSTINTQKNTYQNSLSDSQLGQPYRFQLSSKSSFDTRSVQSMSRPTNQPQQWNASFLNRQSSNVSDYDSFDFSRPTANATLGSKGENGKIAAQLKVDFGKDSPTKGVQKNNFALQAWTRVKLKEGRFYKVSSDSDDGTRFFFKDRQTGETLTTLSGDWRSRRTSQPEWNKVISVAKGGKYDFFIQYYEKSGRSTINVKLEEVEQTGRVTTTTGLNVRTQPSTTGNTPFRRLDINETFKIRRQVKTTGDSSYPDWYEIDTKDGKRGFVAAASGLAEVVNGANIVALGTSELITTPPVPVTQSNPTGSFGTSSGSIPSKGFVKGGATFRAGPGTGESVLADLSQSTPLDIVGKVSGDRYIANDVGYDQWYKVKSNGQIGYVAAYYVNGGDNGGKYPSALNSKSTIYSEDLAAANPYKTAVTQAAAPYSSWLKPSILAAIGSRESAWGLVLAADGTGDGGHGRGIMQIDDRYHQDFINNNDWRNPGVNIKYAVDNVLADYYSYLSRNTSLKGFDLLRGAIASYNAGPQNVVDAVNAGLDVDAYTTGKDYSWDVIQRAGWFQDNGWT
jgi:Bacterial SH3 domain/Transglycosylase SLT domain